MKAPSRLLLWLVLVLQVLVLVLAMTFVAIPLAKRSAADLAGLISISAKTWQELSADRRLAFVESLQQDTGLTIEQGQRTLLEESWKPHWYADWVEQALISQGEQPLQVAIHLGVLEVHLLLDEEPIVLRTASPQLGWIFAIFFLIGLFAIMGTFLALWWQKRWQRQMMRQQVMLSGLAHDLRTPLTRLQLQLSLLPQLDVAEQALFRDQIQLMSEQIGMALILAQTQPSTLLPKTSLNNSWQDWQQSFPTVVFQVTCTSLLERLVPNLLNRIVQNLIVNATVHGKGQVIVKLSEQGKQWQLRITDEGAGISDHVWRAIKSYQRPQAKGVGLGLLSSMWLADIGNLRIDPCPGGCIVRPVD